jgi:hypothetical protein
MATVFREGNLGCAAAMNQASGGNGQVRTDEVQDGGDADEMRNATLLQTRSL